MKLYDKGIENIKWLFVKDPKGKISCQEILDLIPSLTNASSVKKVMIKFQEKHPEMGMKKDVQVTHLSTWSGIKIASMEVLLNRYKEVVRLGYICDHIYSRDKKDTDPYNTSPMYLRSL